MTVSELLQGIVRWISIHVGDRSWKSTPVLIVLRKMSLKGHSHFCDCADLDTSFSHFEKRLP